MPAFLSGEDKDWIMSAAILARLLLAGALVGATGIPGALAQANRPVAAPPQPGAAAQPLRNGFDLPPAGEARFVPNEVMLDIPAGVSTQTLDAIAARHRMTRLETRSFRLTGRTLHRWRLDGGGTVLAMIRGLAGERDVAGAQPNYLYALQQDGLPVADTAQYAAEKLDLPDAHHLATGAKILVALIDSGVDTSHPDLVGAVTADFDAATDAARQHPHGTGMAGAIAARRTLLGVAPRVGLLTVRAFGSTAGDAEGTTFNIIKGLDWAAERSARIVNMSFAGPPDPRLHDALLKASRKGMVLIAAAGNAGPNSAPLYPAADPNVIAVTATDAKDALFARANRGDYIAVAAPGVDILVPAPDGTYQLTTGTSVAAAEVSGVAALLIERNPSLTPKDVRAILMRTAKSLGPKGRDQDFGAGLVNAFKAVSAVKSK
jgi:subtilisin family serine protease